MKRLLMLFLATLMLVSSAGPVRYRPHHHPHCPYAREACRSLALVPWKSIAAGGAAAGTMIAAYKISDGIEEGIKTAAREKPEVLPDTLSVLTWPLRWALLIFLLCSGVYVWCRFTNTKPKEKEHENRVE